MIIGIVGSRRRTRHDDYIKVFDAFLQVYSRLQIGTFIKIISGGCKTGADSWAEDIAHDYGIIFNDKDYQPDFTGLTKDSPKWDYTQRYYARNEKLAKDADVLIACVADDRTGGTENTIEAFNKYHPDGVLILV